VSGEAILSAENSGKTFGRSGLRHEPHWGWATYSTSPDPTDGGLAVPSARTPPPLLAFGLDYRPFDLGPPPMKHPGHSLEGCCSGRGE